MDKKFIINLKGKEFVKYEGLLDQAHKLGLKSIETEMLPWKDSESIFKSDTVVFRAVVNGERGTFTGYGDANKTNVGNMIAQHMIRMAETRAKARALRDYCNIGMCSVEELGGDDKPQQAKPTPVKPEEHVNPDVLEEIRTLREEKNITKEQFSAWVRDHQATPGDSLAAAISHNTYEILYALNEKPNIIKDNLPF